MIIYKSDHLENRTLCHVGSWSILRTGDLRAFDGSFPLFSPKNKHTKKPIANKDHIRLKQCSYPGLVLDTCCALFILQKLWICTSLNWNFLLIGIQSMQGWTASKRDGVTRKRRGNRWKAYRKTYYKWRFYFWIALNSLKHSFLSIPHACQAFPNCALLPVSDKTRPSYRCWRLSHWPTISFVLPVMPSIV